MPKSRVTIEGLEEYKRALRDAPESMRAEAAPIVRRAAEATKDTIERLYPRSNQNSHNHLKDGAYVWERGPLTFVTTNVAPHAHLYELGTITRTTRRTGANRGRMPAKPTIIPTAIRERALMVSQLVHLVRSYGFTVTESGG